MSHTEVRFPPIDLKADVHGCLRELENCSNGLVYFDHLWGRVIDDIDKAEETYEAYESEAAEKVRESAPNAATATEIKAGINRYIERRKDAREARDELKEARRRKAKLERWIRSLEKRQSAAQTAQNGHAQIAKGGGGG